jgi:hypothetical protein
MIESPSVPTDAITAFEVVPAGKFTTRVPGSVPNSTLRSVEVEEDLSGGVLMSGLVILLAEASAVISDAVGGTARASGTPITTTYTTRNAQTKLRPYVTKSS